VVDEKTEELTDEAAHLCTSSEANRYLHVEKCSPTAASCGSTKHHFDPAQRSRKCCQKQMNGTAAARTFSRVHAYQDAAGTKDRPCA
jgi:hypothetical protein